MNSRLRKNSKHIFECFLEVVGPQDQVSQQKGHKDPWILQSYPPSFKDQEAEKLKSVSHFVFPCPQLEITAVQNFSFVLTDIDAHWTFGFCRIAPKTETALVFLSSLPWHEIFYRLLNRAAEITHHSSDDGELWRFLESTYNSKVPEFGSLFHLTWKTANGSNSDVSFLIPHRFSLPSIPDNRNLTEYYNACGINSMLSIFASMLKERRIIVTSGKLSRLSACVQAANALIFPMQWQHIFIPVLPNHLIDYLSAPMPFLIGVPAPIMQRVKLAEMGEVVILDADANQVRSPFDDVGSLPMELTNNLRKSLKNPNEHGGEAIPRAFLQALVHLIGGYRDALKMRPGEPISFDDSVFVSSRPVPLQPFLQEMLNLQIFRQFIEERIDTLNRGNSLSDEFEKEAVLYSDKINSQNPGSRIIKKQFVQATKEGGALVKAVRDKANPVMKTAVKSVKEGGKQAYREMKHKIKDNQTRTLRVMGSQKHKRSGSPSSLSTGTSDGQPQSAPGSPTYMGGRRTMSVTNVTSTGGSLARERNGTGGSKGSVTSSGLTRYNTEFGFGGRVLKYERFDPPTVVSLTSTLPNVNYTQDQLGESPPRVHNQSAGLIANERSPEMEAPPMLDLDLMTDMKDFIYKKPSPAGPPPTVNRELKPVGSHLHHQSLTRTSMSSSQPFPFQDVKLSRTSQVHVMPASKPKIVEGNNNLTHHKLERAMPSQVKTEPAADLISLGDDMIFDPLLIGTSISSTVVSQPQQQQVMLPRPPPSTRVAAITQKFEQHLPLQQRDATNPFRNGTRGGYENFLPVPNGDLHMNGASNPVTPVRAHRAAVTKSSEDLLQEYGLDFSKFSIVSNSSNIDIGPSQVPKRSTEAKDKFDIFADLDPLQNSSTSTSRPRQQQTSMQNRLNI